MPFGGVVWVVGVEGGWEEALEMEERVVVLLVSPVDVDVEVVDAGVSCRASIPVDAELTDPDDFLLVTLSPALALLGGSVDTGVCIVTTFTPIASPAEEGMNRDVTSFFLSTVRSG